MRGASPDCAGAAAGSRTASAAASAVRTGDCVLRPCIGSSSESATTIPEPGAPAPASAGFRDRVAPWIQPARIADAAPESERSGELPSLAVPDRAGKLPIAGGIERNLIHFALLRGCAPWLA